ncbi:hypothetical protein [Paenibacillus sp. HGF7]|nr:hypothetical protein [Paenibacillus sp. HGF7]
MAISSERIDSSILCAPWVMVAMAIGMVETMYKRSTAPPPLRRIVRL